MNGFYLGKQIKVNKLTDEKFHLHPDDFLRHAFICGSTGTGKTVLGKILVEEAARHDIPSVIIDLKGDLSSMAIPFANLVPEEVMPWISPQKSGDERLNDARDYITNFKARLKQFSIQHESIREFRQKSFFRIYTPRTRKGEKFSISELYSPPEDIEHYIVAEPEIVAGMIQNMAVSIMGRIYPGMDPKEMIVELSFLEEIIRHLWLTSEELEGISGLEKLIDTIKEPPFETIGRLTLTEFISDEVRMDLVKKLNALILGSQRCWFEGRSISSIIREMADNSDTRILIFNLTELDSFADRSLVVSQLAFSIYNTYRRKHADHLELLFYLDEIGGSDNNAFFPPEPYFNLAKPALNLLLRQGRAFGVGMVLATQNPGDIDYKGLTNCHSWFVGKLLTDEDRNKALEGISRAEIKLERASDFVRDAREGSFLVKARSGRVFQFQERWLFSIHKILGGEDLEMLKKEMNRKKEYLDAFQILKKGEIDKAISLFHDMISKHPEDSGNYYDLAEILLKNERAEEALSVIERAEKAGIIGDQLFFKKAIILFTLKDYSKAELCFTRSLELNPSLDQAHYYLGEIYRFWKQLDAALTHISEASRNNYLQEDYWYLKARVLREKGSYYEALAALENALKSVPDSEVFNAYKVYLLVLAGKIEDAAKFAPTLTGESAMEYFAKALLAKAREDGEQYADLIGKAYSKGQDYPPVLFTMAEAMYRKKDIAGSLENIEKALELEPHHPEYWYLHARLMVETGQVQKALEDIDKALKVKDDYRFCFVQGEIHRQKGELDLAVQSYTKALELRKDYMPAYVRLVEILMKSDLKKALKAANDALEIKPVPDIFRLKSRILFLQNYTREALNNIDEFLVKNPKDIGGWELRAEILKKENNWQKVYENYLSMIEKVGPRENYFIEASQALANQTQMEEAVDVLDRALEKFPESIPVWEKLAGFYRKMKEEEKAIYCEQQIAKFKSGGSS